MMKRYCLVLFLSALPGVAWADHFEQVISFQCSLKANKLIITHHGAYNEEGDQLVKDLHQDEWNVQNLLMGDGETAPVASRRPVLRQCNLHGGSYRIAISGVTWNQVGSDQTAHVLIKSGVREVFNGDLESSPFETALPHLVISRITVLGGAEKPQVTTASGNTVY